MSSYFKGIYVCETQSEYEAIASKDPDILYLVKGQPIAWGDIGGTLSEQTDLQDALDNKADSSDLPTIIRGTVQFTTPAAVSLTRTTFTFTDIGTTDYNVILTPMYALSGFADLQATVMSKSTGSCQVAVWNRGTSAAATATYMITIIAN